MLPGFSHLFFLDHHRKVTKLETPYPSISHWIIETDLPEATRNLWKNHIKTSRQPDKQHKRYPVHLVDTGLLQPDHNVDPDTQPI